MFNLASIDMVSFIRLKDEDRKSMFSSIKKNLGTSWEEVYPRFNTSRTMFFNYMSGRYDIPKETFIALTKIAQSKITNLEEVQKTKHLEKEILKPQMSNSLAEIFGVLNGDGHINKLNHEICVVGSVLERDYFDYLKHLFEGSLHLSFSIQPQNTKLKLRAYSKQLADILHEDFGLPKGNKLGKLNVPKQVLLKKALLKSYVRGLFDTDGSVYLRRNKDQVVNISSADKMYLMQIKEALNSLGVNSSISKKNIYVYKKQDVDKFFKIIKPANSKHLKRDEKFNTLARMVYRL